MTTFGRVEIVEQIYRLGRAGREIRPFATGAGVVNRGYSRVLQRVMTDFGAEESFQRAAGRIQEHYGIEIGAGAVRRATLKHAEAIEGKQREERREEIEGKRIGVATVVAEMDGAMTPIVRTRGKHRDKRKNRAVKWEETRLVLAREHGSATPRYGATKGDVEEAGAILLDCVARARAGAGTLVHCLGDGATWIRRQVERRFGGQGQYLVDFYHVSEYVAAAAATCAPANGRLWISQQKEALLENRIGDVLERLAPRVEGPEHGTDETAPVRACHRYLTNRRDVLDYKGARAAGLPIGSGEIEAGHRSVLQQRLKISGAWWLPHTAHIMAALRVHRANGDWNSYWEDLRRSA